MVQSRHLQYIKQPTRRAATGIAAAKNHPAQSRMNERARAHRARFFRHVKIAIIEPPIFDDGFGLRDCQHFRVRGGILQEFHLIVGAGNNFAVLYDDGADGNFLAFEGSTGLTQRFTHKIDVALGIDENRFFHESEIRN